MHSTDELAAGTVGGVLSYFTRHKTLANLLLVALVLIGLALAPRLRAQFFPDTQVDSITVAVIWDGAGAEDVDRGIIQLIEPVLLAIDGVETSKATSTEGRASVVLEFEPDSDMTQAASDVQTALDLITDLPLEAEEPTVRLNTWSDGVTDVVITGPVAPEQLALFADELVIRLFEAGVTRTSLQGMVAPETIVEVSITQLMAHDITMAEIAGIIAEEVSADPAGDVTGANLRVRTGQEKRSAWEIESIVLRSNPGGSVLRVADLAKVHVNGPDRELAYFVGDNPAVTVRVSRSSKGDALKIQSAVETVVAEMQGTLPKDVQMDLIRTRADNISGRLQTLLDNGATGLVLVIVLLFLFLNARTAFWVAAGIPVAMLTALSIMYLSGMTLNMISMFALIITLGIVVDDAIVVGEHADARVRSFGESPVVAAERAAQRMAMPVLTATLTTIIAFFGLVAIGGRFGTLIYAIPFTVIAVLVASLIECFLILPNHMAHALRHSHKRHWYDWPSRMVNRGFSWFRDNAFRPLVFWVIKARYLVLSLAILLLVSQVVLFIEGKVVWRFFNAPERSSVTVNYLMTPGTSRAATTEMMHELQRATKVVGEQFEAEHGRNPLDYVIAGVGGQIGWPLSGASERDVDEKGAIAIELIDPDLRDYSSYAFLAALGKEVRVAPEVGEISFRRSHSGPGGQAIDIELIGADAAQLKAAAEDVKTKLARFAEVSGVEDSLEYDKDEIVLELTPLGQALGFSIDTLGRVLRHRINGIEAASYPEGPRSAEIRVELPEQELKADFLQAMQIRTPGGEYVPLVDLVEIERRAGFAAIERKNGLQFANVTGDIAEDDPARAAQITESLRSDILPEIASLYQIDFRLSGLAEQEQDFLKEARTGLILALAGIYLCLAWVFASWTRPLIVMAVIPFGLIGTIYGHAQWDVPLSMFTVVGLLGLVGIIVNDSIVLVTTIDEYAAERGLVPSIIDGTAERLRPVFLTTATTVFGLMPLLFERAQQAQFLKPSVITLIYGLGVGMFIVLLVVPALLAIQQDIERHMTTLRRSFIAPVHLVRRGMYVLTLALLVWAGLTLFWPMVQSNGPLSLASEQLGTMIGGLLSFVLGAGVIITCGGVFLYWRLKHGKGRVI